VLLGKADTGQEVVVVGGRIVGISAALYLAEKGKMVSVITRSQVARGLGRNYKMAIFDKLVTLGINLYPHTVPDSISENGVNVQWNSGDSERPDNVFGFIKADTVVLAVGAENDNKLAKQLEGKIAEVHAIGDCAGKRSVFAAMHGGADIAVKI